jgi:hypothetical protein
MEQKYPGYSDDVKHFYEVLPYFHDSRYIRQNNKPVFCIYRPLDHPYLERFIETWHHLAINEGLAGIYFIGLVHGAISIFGNLDAVVVQDAYLRKPLSILDKLVKKTTGVYPDDVISRYRYNCYRLSYAEMIGWTSNFILAPYQIPNILSGWDNTPRTGNRGRVFHDYNPELFGKHVCKVLNQVKDREETLCFIKSWNEWAEGNYLEPETRYGLGFLEEFKNAVKASEFTPV